MQAASIMTGIRPALLIRKRIRNQDPDPDPGG
jgi:hypothetical protein